MACWLWLAGVIAVLVLGCAAADDTADVAETRTETRRSAPSVIPEPSRIDSADSGPGLGEPGPAEAPPGLADAPAELLPGEPAPAEEPADPDGPSDYQQVDQAIEGLITRNATWQAPPSLQVNKTENVALAIGDVQSLQDEIAHSVPTVSPRPPQEIEIGSRVRARLMVSAQDATVAPLESINKSVGEQTSIMFSWQVTALKPGDLILSAHIEFPLTDEHVTTQIVPLNIPVQPAEPVKQPWTRTLQELIKNYWVQLTTAGGAVVAGARLGWGWYKR